MPSKGEREKITGIVGVSGRIGSNNVAKITRAWTILKSVNKIDTFQRNSGSSDWTAMRVESLEQFFKGEITAQQLVSEISDEVKEHIKLLQKKGASAPVYVYGKGPVKITSKDVLKLCDTFSSKELQEAYINYIVDAILLSEEFKIENENIEECLFLLSDPVVNGPIDGKRISAIKAFLL